MPAGSADYFEIFGLSRKFSQDWALLRHRLYGISRALHPDRFTVAGPEARRHSLERMSLVNKAYQTLRTPEALREYLLSREGIAVPKAAMPAELAEDWFEIQDMLMEEPDLARALVATFGDKLIEATRRTEERLERLESEADDSGLERSRLEAIGSVTQEMAYLRSLRRDVERITRNFEGKRQ